MSFMNKVYQVNEYFSYFDDNSASLLLYDDERFNDNKKIFILSASIKYILRDCKVFDFPQSDV